jgi:hypothetical protein
MPRILDELNQVRSEVISRGEHLVFKLSSCLLNRAPSASKRTEMLAARGPGIHQPNGMGLSEIPALPVLRLYVIKLVIKSAAISGAFSLVTSSGEFWSPASKTYSRVSPSFAAPRYRKQFDRQRRKGSKRVTGPDAEVTQSHSESWTVSVRVY